MRNSSVTCVRGLTTAGHRIQAGASSTGKNVPATTNIGTITPAITKSNWCVERSLLAKNAPRQAKPNPPTYPMRGASRAVGRRETPKAHATRSVIAATIAVRTPVHADSPVTSSAKLMGAATKPS